MKPACLTRVRPRAIALRLTSALTVLTTSLAAQVAPAPAARPEEETLVLSPFEVSASLDTGYLASTAQSGTRLRTELKDIASSISVVTKDFLNDIGAKDLEGLLVYTLGTEVNGVGGNFSDAGVVNNPNGAETDYDNAFASAAPSTRVRGLTSADLSRDFFITNIPLDTYNVERVEISRGPNAMLFGLGSPSGIINNSLITAGLRQRKTELEFRTDKYGSARGVLDHNEVLLRDKLAVRVASVYEEQKYRVEEAFRRNKRAHVTATWRPFRHTTVRASTEIGRIISNLPETRPPYDSYTQWWLMGRPAWDPTTNTGVALGTPAPGWPAPFTATGAATPTGNPPNSGNLFSGQVGAMGSGSQQMVLVYNDPNSSVPNLGLPGSDLMGFRNGNYDRHSPNTPGGALQQRQTRGVRDWAYILNRVFHFNDITYNFWRSVQITDPGYFDFYNHMLHGPNKREFADFNTYNITLDQQFLDGRAGAEVAFNRDTLDNGSMLGLDSIISGYTLRIDMNTKLGDGRPNPNFGRPFTTAYSKMSVRSYDRDTVRGTAFYTLDLRKTRGPAWLGRVLGHHRFTGTYSELTNTALLENGNFAFASGLDFSLAQFGDARNLGSANRGLPIVRYLGPDVSASPTPVKGVFAVPTQQLPRDLNAAKILFYNTPPVNSTTPGTWSERTFSILAAGEKDTAPTRRYIAFTREKVNSAVGIAQSYWLEGNLVSTLGWRRDDVQTFSAGTPTIDPATGNALLDRDFHPKPVTRQVETSFNYGVVAHAPEFVSRRLPWGSRFSVVYNRADNFRPAGQRFDIFDRPLPAETGETKEYGVMLTTLNGKIVLKATRYETTSGLSSSLLSSFTIPINNLVGALDAVQTQNLRGRNAGNPAGVAAWNEWYNGPVGSALRNTFRFRNGALGNGEPDIISENRSGEVVATADVVSKGEEYEIIFNPTRNWRIALNASRAEAQRSNVGTQFRELMFNSINPLMDGPAGDLFHTDDLTNTQPVRDRMRMQVFNQMLPELANEGAPTSELREWRANAVTNYSFTEGRLKGFSVGGAIRWQDKVAIGYPIIVHPTFGITPDVKNPYYGPTETNYDAWIGYGRKFRRFNWRIQLNVQNIGVGDKLIPISAQPDGSINSWRIAAEQSWTLRNTFSF